ncbi:MAG: hypothetical protein DWQ04_34835 [Chloroflexi bacterium]|nr:MAG: hypothetical protein DWQ04_34835 [Chloroflexota bacterium]
MNTKQKNNWLVPSLLLLFGATNVLFDALQLDTIQQGPPVRTFINWVWIFGSVNRIMKVGQIQPNWKEA